MRLHKVEQNTTAWMDLRRGIPTCSSASRLITSKGEPTDAGTWKGFARELAHAKFTGLDVFSFGGNEYTEYGHLYEPEARAWYANHFEVDVHEIGFVSDDLLTHGGSPDGLIDKPNNDNGGLEIKCLEKKHLEVLLFARKNNRPPSTHIAQCHMLMHITDRDWWDLLYYSPTEMANVCFHLERSEKFETALKQQIAAVLAERNQIIEQLNVSGELIAVAPLEIAA